MVSHTFNCPDPAATQAFGHKLGDLLFPGSNIALVGPLGAGKTFLVRAIAEGLGVKNSKIVSSPTFVLIQEYSGRLPIYHFDAYRLRSPAEFAELGVHEYFAGEGVCLIEWADRVEGVLPRELLHIQIEPTGETTRKMVLGARGKSHQELAGIIVQNISQ